MVRPLLLLSLCALAFTAERDDQLLVVEPFGLVSGSYQTADGRLIARRVGDATQAIIDTRVSPEAILACEGGGDDTRLARAVRTLAWQRARAEADLASLERAIASARTNVPPPAQGLSKETQERYQREMAWKAEQAAVREAEAQKVRSRIDELKETLLQLEGERNARLLARAEAEKARRQAARAGEEERRSPERTTPVHVVVPQPSVTMEPHAAVPIPAPMPEPDVHPDPASAPAGMTDFAPMPTGPVPPPQAQPEAMASTTATPPPPAPAVAPPTPPSVATPAESTTPMAPQGRRTPLAVIGLLAIALAVFLVPAAIAFARQHRQAPIIASAGVALPLVFGAIHAFAADGGGSHLPLMAVGAGATLAWLILLSWASRSPGDPPASSIGAGESTLTAAIPTPGTLAAAAADTDAIPFPDPVAAPSAADPLPPSPWLDEAAPAAPPPSRPPTRRYVADNSAARRPPLPRH